MIIWRKRALLELSDLRRHFICLERHPLGKKLVKQSKLAQHVIRTKYTYRHLPSTNRICSYRQELADIRNAVAEYDRERHEQHFAEEP